AEIEAVLNEFEPRLRSAAARDSSAAFSEQEQEVLTEGGLGPDDLRREAGEDPVIRTAAEYSSLLRASYSTEEAAAILRVNSSRIRQRVSREPRTLYGIRLVREWRIPKFQFDGKHLITG